MHIPMTSLTYLQSHHPILVPGLHPELWAQPGAAAARGWPCGAAAGAGADAPGLHGTAAGDAGTSSQRCATRKGGKFGEVWGSLGAENSGFMWFSCGFHVVFMWFSCGLLTMRILKLKTPS